MENRTPAPKKTHPSLSDLKGVINGAMSLVSRNKNLGTTVIGAYVVDTTHPTYNPNDPFDESELSLSHPAVVGSS